MAIPYISVSIGLGLAIIYAVLRLSESWSRRPKLPGPRGLPLIGNLRDLPPPGTLEAQHWIKHKDLYGPISCVTVMGQPIVIINDAQLAFELLEKRSAKYSSRPKQIFAGEMLGWENTLGLSPYNDRFRTYRKNMSRIIGSKTSASQFNTLQESEVGHFLMRLLDQPDDLLAHIRKETGAIILKIAYGYTAEPFEDDVLVDMAGDAMDKFARAAVPGAFMVDVLPILRYLPDWFPGAGFKRTAQQWGAELLDVAEKPYAFVKHQMAQGSDRVSFLSSLVEAGDADGEESFTNKWSAMSLYTAGADTIPFPNSMQTVSAISCFFLAMMLYPEVQRRAQQEIDRVVGRDRLPTAADRDSLPYIEATVKEVLRWHPVAPMGLPHTTTEDDSCEGYFIPKGSMVFANVWHFTHDPAVYKDHLAFKPERFLETDGHVPEPDPHMFSFGFGRRVCPGRILADNSLYLNVVQSLAVFDIAKPIEQGRQVDPAVKFTPGVVSHPEPYKCLITPRSPHHEALIRSVEHKYPWEESDAKVLESMSH